MSRRTPLGRVRGYGSAKEGVGAWWTQRMTSVALIILGCWFAVSLLALPGLDHATVTNWIRGTWTTVALLLFVAVAAWHSQLGVQVIVEDYVHEAGRKTLVLALVTFAHVALATVGVLAVLRVALGGPS